MTRIIVSGAAGRMGRMVSRAVVEQDDLQLVAGYDPAPEEAVYQDPAELPEADVVVEFTNPGVVMDNLALWRDRGSHVVVGTSGFSDDRIEAVRGLFGDGPPNCLIVPNFSIGAVLAMRFAAEAAAHFLAAEIIELHHDGKVDAPSGTAIATAGRIAASGRQQRSVDSTELMPGARGAAVEGVPIHAIRLPGLVAHQEVILGGTGETLTIRHDTSDRQAFIPGVLLGIRGVASLRGVTVGLEPLL